METKVITVSKNGTGMVSTIQEAFALAQEIPQEYSVEIRIEAGIYREKPELERDNVTLIGESAETTRIEFDDYALF